MLQAALRTSYTTWPSRRSSRLHVARTSWVTTYLYPGSPRPGSGSVENCRPKESNCPRSGVRRSRLWTFDRLTRAELLALGVLPKCVLDSRKMLAGSQMDLPKSRTENFARFLRSAAAGGILRVHRHALIAPHAPISSLLQKVWKHARLFGGASRIRTDRRLMQRSV